MSIASNADMQASVGDSPLRGHLVGVIAQFSFALVTYDRRLLVHTTLLSNELLASDAAKSDLGGHDQSASAVAGACHLQGFFPR